MTTAYFVAGTDTGVGKTLVAAALLQRAGLAGMTTAAVKPVAAGCEVTPDGLRNEDALLLQRAISFNLAYDQINPVALALAIAPHLAAAETGRTLTVAALADHCRGILDLGADFTLVEGAGGWRVPVNRDETLADLAQYLQLPVVLVVAMRLGCINHALLTVEAIQRDGLSLAGWVANSVTPAMDRLRENIDTLRSWLPCPLLAEVPFLPDQDYVQAAEFVSLPPATGPGSSGRQRTA